MSGEYLGFVNDLHTHLSRDPNDRALLGIEEDLGMLPDPGLADGRAAVAAARRFLERLEALEADPSLVFDQKLDLQIARLLLEEQVLEETHEFNGRTRRQQLPRASDGICEGVFALFMTDPRPAGERLADITSRLEQAPGYFSAMLNRLDHPVARWSQMDRESLDGMGSLFESLISWAEIESWSDVGRLRLAASKALESKDAYQVALSAMPTTEALHVGQAYAEARVRSMGIHWSLDALHQLACDFLRTNAEEVESLRGRLVARHGLAPDTTSEALQAHLNRLHRVPSERGNVQDILDRYEEERARVRAFCEETGLFPMLPDEDMKIMQTPAFLASVIPAGAMETPAPFRSGTKTSLVYLTLTERAFEEHDQLSIPSMMIHEGIPGHHLQLATAACHSSIVRRHAWFAHHGEGWTTMLEDYMLDVGYVEALTDEVRFVGKRDIARLGARVAIDLFFMTGNRDYLSVGVPCDISAEDPFEAAGNLLRTVTGFTEGRTRGEVSWYSVERGIPLCYLTGNAMVWELKRDIFEAQRGRCEGHDLDRMFHRTFLESGNMPVRLLRQVFEHERVLSSPLR